MLDCSIISVHEISDARKKFKKEERKKKKERQLTKMNINQKAQTGRSKRLEA